MDIPIKTITQHRALSFLLQERIISCYCKLVNEKYCHADSITGTSNWCDFQNGSDWGEIVCVYQKKLPVQWLWQNLFEIDEEKFEKKYQIKIDPDSVPSLPKDFSVSPTVQLDIQSAIKTALEKKLKKQYPYLLEGYQRKGSLLLAIVDPLFAGFSKDLEIRCGTLDLKSSEQITKILAPKSSFSRVLLVNGLASFEEDPENRIYELFNS